MALQTKVPHLMTLADLSVPQINTLLSHSHFLKRRCTPFLQPLHSAAKKDKKNSLRMPMPTLFNKTIALLFSKRSTRTRVSAETSAHLLGGSALFLGRDDIQFGLKESTRDSARVIGGMCQGIFARVGEHEEIEELAKYSPVPVLNALSSLWHPTQILADLLTLHEHGHQFPPEGENPTDGGGGGSKKKKAGLPVLTPLTVAYIGDSSNILHDMLVAYPRLGHKLRVASPPLYRAPKAVWDRVQELGCDKDIVWTDDPKEAVQNADVVVTDTWISMGQEAEKAERLKAFQGFQVTEELCKEGGAKPNWKFLHSLPRKADLSGEVDDEVFYGPRSLVFQASDNRKWTIMALFDLLYGRWNIPEEAIRY